MPSCSTGVPAATAPSVDDLAKSLDRTKLRRVNVSGAEKKRRKKARAAAAAASLAPSQTGGTPNKGAAESRSSGSKTTAPAKPTKRARVPANTPEGLGRAHKRPKTTGSAGSYAQATGDWSLRVAIARESDPQSGFTEEQISEFSDAVIEAVLRTPSGSNSIMPQFTSTRLWEQCLLVTAANAQSRDWLLRELANIQPWAGVRLMAVDTGALRLTRATLWVPGRRHRPDAEVLRILELQNPGLSTSRWRVRMRREDEKGLLLVVGLDNQVSTLRNRGPYLFYGTTRASVQIKERGAAETERPPGTVMPPFTEAQADTAAALGDTPRENLRGEDAGPALVAAPESAPPAGGVAESDLLSEGDSAGDVTLTSDILNSEELLGTSDEDGPS